MALPIVIIHKGNSDYLAYSLTQVVATNPDADVYLIGDAKTKHFNGLIKHFLLTDYWESAAEFGPKFVNLSTNGHDYELFCIQRWFVLHNFMEAKSLNGCIYIDSDILTYGRLNDLQPALSKFGLTVLYKSPHTNYVNSIKALKDFCDFVTWHYSGTEGEKKRNEYYKEHIAEHGTRGGISDMTFFLHYRRKFPEIVADISTPVEGIAFDVTFNTSQGYLMDGPVKKIFWQNNQPYGTNAETGKLVRFLTLHFQGHAKKYLTKNVKPFGPGRKIQTGWYLGRYLLQRILSKLRK